MKMLIEYDEEIVLVDIVSDYTVDLIQDIGNFSYKIRLNQCKHCGVWCSEDDELYGDGFCYECSQICFHCNNYFLFKTMTMDTGNWECSDCHKKLRPSE